MSAKKTANKQDFGKRLKELEEIVDWFENSEIDIETALRKYERGVELAKELRENLKNIENKIKVIQQRFDEE